MKTLLAALILTASFSAQATVVCTGLWGYKAQLTQISNKTIRLDFDNGRYPYSGNMDYVAQNSSSNYYQGLETRAQVDKSVFTTGKGTIWYQYPDAASDHSNAKLSARFDCN